MLIKEVNRIYCLTWSIYRFSTIKIPLLEAASTTERKLKETHPQGSLRSRSQINTARPNKLEVLACDLDSTSNV
ncbi:hypothetical protein F444_15000 [Phytophthora nicotianae P1976]|uniref:Uncharacterized protein n=1 Tax=Phytophthora nicotianae P1976 TaxID=1317066 RepID=A0A080ZND4_PHYNI|nr:hypothetical protein F444_15000 [Phytophthora nicotianae P1976]